MSVCPHGVELEHDHAIPGVLGEIEGAPTVVERDIKGLPRGKCPCCKGQYIYDAPLDERRRKSHCQFCQAVTANPNIDHLAGNPVLKGGPLDGQKVAVLPGTPPEDRINVAGAESEGHYVLAANGKSYTWQDGQELSPIHAVPSRHVVDVEQHYRSFGKKNP